MLHGDHHIQDESGTRTLAAQLAEDLEPGDLVTLTGPLGAGKTTFVRGLLRGMGFAGRVRSPTFTLIQGYPTDPPVHHADLYRLSHPDELVALGFGDIREEGGVLVVEWADRVPGVAEQATVTISITPPGDDSDRRSIRIERRDPHRPDEVNSDERETR